MKAYELKALLASLDDSAEISIELSGMDNAVTGEFWAETSGGFSPRSCCLAVRPEALQIDPEAKSEIEHLEQRLDDLKEAAGRLINAIGEPDPKWAIAFDALCDETNK